MAWFQGLSSLPPPTPPPPRITWGEFGAVCPPHAPSTLLGPACDVILTISAPFRESSQWPRPRGPKGAHLKEETKLNSFLLYGFLIEGLGAEQLAPKDRQKFSKYTRPPIIFIPRIYWHVGPVQAAGTVRERMHKQKQSAGSPSLTWGRHEEDITSTRT